MIALALRLAVTGGRRNVALLAVTTAAVAAGTALLLLALCVAPAMQARADRTAWLDAGFGLAAQVVQQDSPQPHTTVSSTVYTYRTHSIETVLLAGSGPDAPVPPGIAELPAPGQALVSPALADLIGRSPGLADRFGQIVGTIGDSALAGPDALVAVRGVDPANLSSYALAVTSFPSSGEALTLTPLVRLMLVLGAVALLAPIALLVAMATRLSAATRDRRLAALRLAGATSGQVARLAGVESLLAGAGGVLAGAVLFFAVRPLATNVTEDGERWFASDLMPGPVAWVGVLIGVPVVVAAATQLTLRRVSHSPLSVSRRTAPRPVRAWRLIPLAVAVPVLAVVLSVDASRRAVGDSSQLVLAAFAVVLITLLYAGPWITSAVGAALARSNAPSGLLAGRRLQDHPRTGFYAVAGIVLAVLITTTFAATTPAAAESVRDTRITGQQAGSAQADLYSAPPAISAALLADVRATSGVSAATLIYQGSIQDGMRPAEVWIGDCAQIVAATRLTGVPCGQAPVLVAANRRAVVSDGTPFELSSLNPISDAIDDPSVVTAVTLTTPATATMPAQTGVDVPQVIIDPVLLGPTLNQLAPSLLVTQEALEWVRTLVALQHPVSYVGTRQSNFDGFSSDVRRLYRTLTIASLGVFAVAALGLVVALATGLLERRRPFALLRATGTPLRTLRTVTMLEVAAPLITMTALATVVGALVGHWALTGSPSQNTPWASLSLPVVAGVALTLALTSCALPLVRRATTTEETRFE